jgi:hypothetical protein
MQIRSKVITKWKFVILAVWDCMEWEWAKWYQIGVLVRAVSVRGRSGCVDILL